MHLLSVLGVTKRQGQQFEEMTHDSSLRRRGATWKTRGGISTPFITFLLSMARSWPEVI
jgi:hypothetical protein